MRHVSFSFNDMEAFGRSPSCLAMLYLHCSVFRKTVMMMMNQSMERGLWKFFRQTNIKLWCSSLFQSHWITLQGWSKNFRTNNGWFWWIPFFKWLLVAVGQECLSRLISDVCAGLVSEPDPTVDGWSWVMKNPKRYKGQILIFHGF